MAEAIRTVIMVKSTVNFIALGYKQYVNPAPSKVTESPQHFSGHFSTVYLVHLTCTACMCLHFKLEIDTIVYVSLCDIRG